MLPCVDYDATKLLRRLRIEPHDLHASWQQAQRESSFGGTLESARIAAERAAEFAPWRWPKVFTDVRRGLHQTRQVHAASQKLGAKVYSVVSTLGEDEVEMTATILKLLQEIQKDDDPGVRMLCSSLKTDAIETIFPSASMQTLVSYWSASKEGVEQSIRSSTPPDLAGVDIEGEALDALGKARLAFGAVMGEERKRARRVRFGGFREAASWLRDTVIHTFSLVWKYVARFALVGTMIAAVLLTYCAIMGREYKSEYVFEAGKDGQVGRMYQHADIKYAAATAFGILPAFLVPVGAILASSAVALKAAVAAKATAMSFTAMYGLLAATVSATVGAGSYFYTHSDSAWHTDASRQKPMQPGVEDIERVAADQVESRNKSILDLSLSERDYNGGMCRYVWLCMDRVVRFLNSTSQPWIARTIDSFFQSRLADADTALLFENAQQKTFVAGLRADGGSYRAAFHKVWDDKHYDRVLAEEENSAKHKATVNSILAQGAAHAMNKDGTIGMLDMQARGQNYAHATSHAAKFQANTSTLAENKEFPSQLEAINAWHAIRSSNLPEETKTHHKNRLLKSSRHHLAGFLVATSQKAISDDKNARSTLGYLKSFVFTPETLGNATPDDTKLMAYIDNAYDADRMSETVPEAVKMMRAQAVGLSSHFGAMRGNAGLSSVGDALGINAHATTESKYFGAAILSGIFLAWYLVGPMLASAFIVSIGAFAFLYKHDDGKMFGLNGSLGIAIAIFAGLLQLIPEATSDQVQTMQALMQLAMQTSGDVRQYRMDAANAQYQAMQAKAAADSARTGAFASAAAGLFAGVASGGNVAAATAAANAGGNLASAFVRGQRELAAQRELNMSATFFGDYV